MCTHCCYREHKAWFRSIRIRVFLGAFILLTNIIGATVSVLYHRPWQGLSAPWQQRLAAY